MEKGQLKDEISPKDILSQSIKGLQHLHSLGIGKDYNILYIIYITMQL